MNYVLPSAQTLSKDIASLPIFHGLEPEALRELMNSAHAVQHQKGATLLTQGEPAPRFYVVLEGWCGASKGNTEGQEAILQLFHRGDFFFETVLAESGDISPINLVALTPVHVLSLLPGAVRAAQKRSGVLTTTMMGIATKNAQDLREHIEQLTLHTAEQRVGRFLLQMRFNTSPEGKDIVLPFEKSDIAAYLGIKPETLSRVFKALSKQGFIIDRSHLRMPSPEALCKYCDKIAMRSCPFAAPGKCPLAPVTESASLLR